MNEAFLHHIWQHQLFDRDNIKSQDGQSLEVIKAGEHNTDAGPDFFSAQIKINGTLWVGTVEIHLRASEWNKHGHQHDSAYDNCILHVVYECDDEIFRKNGLEICCLELKDRFSEHAWNNYQKLLGTQSWIACSHRIKEVDRMHVNSWMDRLAVERLERKTLHVFQLLEHNNNDWEETFYQLLCAGFGFQINSLPFTMLARQLPLKLIQKFKDRSSHLEALFFGTAGFLDTEHADPYIFGLKSDWNHFKNAFSLREMDPYCWKFLRLRPVNFPTIRVAQLSALFSKTDRLFSQIIEMKDLNFGMNIFDLCASSYWDSHFLFGKESEGKKKFLGQKSIENIFINVVVPVLFSYGLRNDSIVHRHRALDFLEQIPPEDNSIIRNWIKEGIVPNSALHTQALLDLKKNHCSEKKCLTCRIGIELINTLP